MYALMKILNNNRVECACQDKVVVSQRPARSALRAILSRPVLVCAATRLVRRATSHGILQALFSTIDPFLFKGCWNRSFVCLLSLFCCGGGGDRGTWTFDGVRYFYSTGSEIARLRPIKRNINSLGAGYLLS